MIPAREINLGNIMIHPNSGEPCVIEPQDMLSIMERELNGYNQNYEPIPLDAEWLERLQMPDGVFSGNQFFSVAPLTSNPKVYGLYFENEYTGMDFMYVHDLQNFSALTGTQLTTKKEI